MGNMETDAKNIIQSLNFMLYIFPAGWFLARIIFESVACIPKPSITSIALTPHSHYYNKIFILCRKKLYASSSGIRCTHTHCAYFARASHLYKLIKRMSTYGHSEPRPRWVYFCRVDGWRNTLCTLICVKFYNNMFILDFSLCCAGIGERL